MTSNNPHLYEIIVNGHLSVRIGRQFEAQRVIARSDGTTAVLCSVADQAALYALIDQLARYGLTLLALRRVDLPDR
jgi:hypothetical protein